MRLEGFCEAGASFLARIGLADSICHEIDSVHEYFDVARRERDMEFATLHEERTKPVIWFEHGGCIGISGNPVTHSSVFVLLAFLLAPDQPVDGDPNGL